MRKCHKDSDLLRAGIVVFDPTYEVRRNLKSLAALAK